MYYVVNISVINWLQISELLTGILMAQDCDDRDMQQIPTQIAPDHFTQL
jgi:hypothetical protein